MFVNMLFLTVPTIKLFSNFSDDCILLVCLKLSKALIILTELIDRKITGGLEKLML